MTAKEIIHQWNSMTDKEQYTFCQNCVRRAISHGRKIKPGYDFDDATHSTFEGVLKTLANPDKLDADSKRRKQQGKAENTLAAVVCRAANNSMERISYHAERDSRATSRTIISEEGNEIDVLDTIAAADNTEDSAIIRATLQQFVKSLDQVNQQILAGRLEGKTERELGAVVGISGAAVHKRIVKMRASLASMLK